jgi:hypothetical protein
MATWTTITAATPRQSPTGTLSWTDSTVTVVSPK